MGTLNNNHLVVIKKKILIYNNPFKTVGLQAYRLIVKGKSGISCPSFQDFSPQALLWNTLVFGGRICLISLFIYHNVRQSFLGGQRGHILPLFSRLFSICSLGDYFCFWGQDMAPLAPFTITLDYPFLLYYTSGFFLYLLLSYTSTMYLLLLFQQKK